MTSKNRHLSIPKRFWNFKKKKGLHSFHPLANSIDPLTQIRGHRSSVRRTHVNVSTLLPRRTLKTPVSDGRTRPPTSRRNSANKAAERISLSINDRWTIEVLSPYSSTTPPPIEDRPKKNRWRAAARKRLFSLPPRPRAPPTCVESR